MNVTQVFAAMSGLSSVQRYSMSKLIQPESVLEHIGMVTFLSTIMAREINLMETEEVVDVEWISICSLTHDLDELVTGDIPRPTKHRNERTVAMFSEIATWGVERVVAAMELSGGLQDTMLSSHARAKKGRDGLIVAIADCMCVVMKIWEELLVRGNHAMVGHAVKILDQLASLRRQIHQEFGDVGSATSFLCDVIDQCEGKMDRAASKDDPIFASNMRT